MDSDRLDSGRVDQLFTGYSSSGMRALESTFEDAELHRRWEQTLIHYVRLDTFGRDDPPPSAFTYITFDHGTAAILRRVRGGDSAGRNNAHALIGPAHLLGAVALDLTRWNKWASDREHAALQPLTEQDLGVAPETSDILDDAANGCAESAVPLMGRVLRQPGVNLSSIALDQERIVPTLRLFERVLKPLFSIEERIRNWSFSTYEVTDDDQGSFRRPELIFLPKLPNHAGETRHDRIFFDETMQVEGEYQQLAHHLITKYLRLGSEEYVMAMDSAVGSMPDVNLRIRHLLSNGIDRKQHVPSSVHTAPPGFSPQPGGHQKVESPWTQAVGGDVLYRQQQSIRTSAVHRPGPQAPSPVPSWNTLDDKEIVRQPAAARDGSEIGRRLTVLRERVTPVPATDNDRWMLIYRHEILRLLSKHLYPWDLLVAYGHVLEFAFGTGARAIHEQRSFGWVEGLIKNTKVSVLFGCMVYYFVKDSPMGGYCAQLLHQRSAELKNISLVPVDMMNNQSNGGSTPVGWGDRLLAFCRNSRLLILLILLLLVSIVVVSIIIIVV